MHSLLGTKVRKVFAFLVITSVLCASLLTTVAITALATGATITLSPQAGPPTTAVTVKGTTFKAGETVAVAFDSTVVRTVQANSSGTFTTLFTVPRSSTPGTHTVQATGKTSGQVAKTVFLVRTDWLDYGFVSQGTRFNRFENTLSPGNVPALKKFWTLATNGPVGQSSPVVFAGVAYIASHGGTLYGLNATTGQFIWQTDSFAALTASPAVGNGNVYFTDVLGDVEAVNAVFGGNHRVASASISDTSNTPFTPVIANGDIYLGSDDGTLHAFDAKLNSLWTASTGAVATSEVPAIANGIVYIGSANGRLFAFNATTGAPIWNASTGAAIVGGPAIANGIVYIGSANGSLFAFNATTGASIWNASTGAALISSPAVAANGMVYVGSTNGTLFAFNATTGVPVWHTSTGSTPLISAPAVANGVLYIGTGSDKFLAFSASTGKLLFSFTTGGAVNSSPTVVNGVVYVGSDDGNLYAFHL